MIRKRSSFWTVVFSLLPGAGHMFMGFMKLGLSFMTLFFGIIFLSSFFSLGALMYLLPILWFYAFFDALNKCFATDELFNCLQDDWLFPLNMPRFTGEAVSRRVALGGGVALILLGVYLLWHNFVVFLFRMLPEEVYDAILRFSNSLPQLVVGAAIIVLGVWLIAGRRKESGGHA